MSRRELAINALWSERPLVLLFQRRTGKRAFSLRELIQFSEGLPAFDFELVRAMTEAL